ncbi:MULTISPECIES: hypothetical protein [Hymenobacter]|uniref:Uncharacterized protein n=1 Tax=Hymenobacter mucosus TaxID=1411120 RepID=A0A238Z485_9BACT|nr:MULTISPECIES: hypothetical protein [Hymenobacter]SNR77704.1 hypothetical protein SAMN06269173_106300 [Hymenobacter mucosus]
MLNLTPTEERLNQPSKQRFSHYFMLVMSVVYCGLGIFFWTDAASALTISSTKRQLLGLVFVFYGIVRFVRTYQHHFRKRNDDAR